MADACGFIHSRERVCVGVGLSTYLAQSSSIHGHPAAPACSNNTPSTHFGSSPSNVDVLPLFPLFLLSLSLPFLIFFTLPLSFFRLSLSLILAHSHRLIPFLPSHFPPLIPSHTHTHTHFFLPLVSSFTASLLGKVP